MKNVILLFFFLINTTLFAQGFKLAGIEYNTYPKASVINSDDNQEIAFQEIGVFLNLPIKFKNKKTTIINGFRYDLIESSFYNSPVFPQNQNQKKLHKLSYAFTLTHKWNDKWTFITRLIPILASDLKEKVNLNLKGTALMSYKINKHFKIGAGLLFTNQTGKSLLLPALQIKYNKNKSKLNALLPLNINYLYSLDKNEKINIGLKAAFIGANFNIKFTNSDNTNLARINHVVYNKVNIGGLINIKITKMLQLEFFGGISTARKYTFINFDKTFYQLNPQKGAFFSMGLNFIPQKKKSF